MFFMDNAVEVRRVSSGKSCRCSKSTYQYQITHK